MTFSCSDPNMESAIDFNLFITSHWIWVPQALISRLFKPVNENLILTESLAITDKYTSDIGVAVIWLSITWRTFLRNFPLNWKPIRTSWHSSYWLSISLSSSSPQTLNIGLTSDISILNDLYVYQAITANSKQRL